MVFDDAYKQEILRKIREKIPGYKCPMCGSRNFDVADGFIVDVLRAQITIDLDDAGEEVEVLPAVALVCGWCGFTAQHAAAELGLLGGDITERE